ncbi:MAG TPA: hypothetical protein VFN78_03230 [Ktedonobacterales bacterium]|nr:hypothetical protein [Ktedonobacterales bacterium]
MSEQVPESQPPQWSAGDDAATPPMLPTRGPQPDPQGQYGPYYPPTVPFQPAYQVWQPAPAIPAPQPARAARMPKGEAVAITKKLKAALIAGSVMAFGVLTALAAGHVTGATAGAAGGSGASPSNSATNSGSTTAPTNPANGGGDDGGFFNQGPASSSSSSSSNSSSGGFGVSPNAPAQPPLSGSTVS